VIKMSAERRMKHLEILGKVRQHLWAKEKAQVAEEERIRQEAEKRALIREIEYADRASANINLEGGREDENSRI